MLRWLKRIFKREPRGVVYPFAPLIQAMRDKDMALYSDVGCLSPMDAVRRWREVYPEDFVGVEGHSPWPSPSTIKSIADA